LQELQSLESLERLQSLESLERLENVNILKDVVANCLDYRDVELPKNNECIIYLDPPYR
jgi:site-specific DNA-adenine methylase